MSGSNPAAWLPEITSGLPDGSTTVIDNPLEGVPPGHRDDVNWEGAVDDAANGDDGEAVATP